MTNKQKLESGPTERNWRAVKKRTRTFPGHHCLNVKYLVMTWSLGLASGSEAGCGTFAVRNSTCRVTPMQYIIITRCALVPALCVMATGQQLGKWRNSTSHILKPTALSQKLSRVIRSAQYCARFGAGQSIGVFWGNRHIFQLWYFYFYFDQSTRQAPGRILTRDCLKTRNRGRGAVSGLEKCKLTLDPVYAQNVKIWPKKWT